MKIGVTGGSGAVGTFVCDELIGAGHETVILDMLPPRADATFIKVDLCNLEDTCKAVEGLDQIIHLAAIPHPFNDPSDRVMKVNVTASFNVFEAARIQGVRRVIYGCSESSSGLGIHNVVLKPQYVPIDEGHPLWPHETYGLSKHFGERIGENYARAYGLEVISLRYAWVWVKRDREAVERIIAKSRAGRLGHDEGWLGAHIAVRDVARACLAAAQYRFGADRSLPFEAFYLTAQNTFCHMPTLDVLHAVYNELPSVADQTYFDDNPHASVFDIRKAQRLLGWTPRCDWKHFEQWEF